MSLRDDVAALLKRLRLTGVLDSLDPRLTQAGSDDLSHLEFLYRLLSDEAARRDKHQLDLRLRRASFEQPKVLEDFNFTFNPGIQRSRVLDLATCRFCQERTNVLLIGPTGVGKSHLAQALGHQACRQGLSVLYVTARDLFKRLRAARADQTYERELERLVRPELLIVDDVGLLPLRDDEPLDFYEVVARRYERGSLVMTSNRDLAEWYPLFRDGLLASAAMDRLLHRAEVLVLEGDTYRNPDPERRHGRSGSGPGPGRTHTATAAGDDQGEVGEASQEDEGQAKEQEEGSHDDADE